MKNYNLPKIIGYNFFCKKIVRNGGKILPQHGTCIILDKNAKIDLGGNLVLNANCIKKNGRSSILRLDAGSILRVEEGFQMYYGADIIIFSGGSLKLGSGFCNSNVKIRCKERIEIGYDVAISHDVTIMDSDFHEIDMDGFNISAPVHIGNHVWIGTRAIILKGVHIGDGAVVAAGSIVAKDVPAGALVAGVPAKILRREIKWK